MEPRNVRETIVASAIVRLRAVCMLVARVGKPGTRPTRIPIDDSPHAPRGKQAATAVDRAAVLRQHA
jgi:hypothetical protein